MRNRAFHKNGLFLVLAAAVALQPGCRSMQRLPGQWLAIPTAADGQVEDFSKKITSHLFESGMMVGLGNDERNLYVFFTPDIRHRRHFPGRATLTLWLDTQGGKARKLGLVHVSEPDQPATPPGTGMGKGDALDPAGPPDGRKREWLKVIDRGKGKELFISAVDSLGPAVRLASDWGDFAYQLRIPFRGADDWPGVDIGPGRGISIGLQWRVEPLFPPGKGRHGRPGKGGPGRTPSQGMEGDSPGPGRGRPGEVLAESPVSKRKIWLRTVLAGK